MTTLPKSQLPFAVGIPAIVWQILLFYIPLGLIILSSFLNFSEIGQFEGLTLSHIKLFFSTTYFNTILASLVLAITNGLLCLAIAFPLAYFLVSHGRKYRNLLLFFLIVPFWTNFLLHVYAWFYVLERHGFINTILLQLHIISEPLQLLNSMPAVMIMMVYYYLPFMVFPLYSTLERFNFHLVEASLDLGASFSTTLWRILLPLASRGIRAGFFLVFIPSFGEFVIPELMGGDKKAFVGTVVSQYILGEGTGSLGAAFTLISSITLILASCALYLLLTRLLRPRGSHG